MSDVDRLEQARLLYERAVFGGNGDALELAVRELDGVEADLALARGRIFHARFLETRQEDPYELELFERAAQLYRDLGDTRREGEALFWIGTFHQVVRDDSEGALPSLRRSYELAAAAGDNRGKREEALALADEAGSIAEASNAAGILRWIERFRADLD